MERQIIGRLTACGWLLFLLLWSSPALLRAAEIVGSDAPDFSLADLQGNLMQLSKIQDRPMMLVHLQVYCQACREEIPRINRIYREYPNLHVLAVAIGNDPAEVAEFVKTSQAELPILPDPQRLVLKRYFVNAVPLIDLIDRSGTLRYRGQPDSLPELKAILEDLLKEVAPSSDIVNGFPSDGEARSASRTGVSPIHNGGQKCAACSVRLQKEKEGVGEELHGSSTHSPTSKMEATNQEAPSRGSCH